MIKKNIWIVKFYWCSSQESLKRFWATENVTAETIDDALRLIRLYGKQKNWVDLDIHSIESSHQILVDEEGDLE